MNIYVNGEFISLEPESNIESLISFLGIDGGQGIAVALNEKVVPKENWSKTMLHENDRILCIHAVQGG